MYIIALILFFNKLHTFEIPLTYAFSMDKSTKYPIELSFDSTQTSTPQSNGILHLYSLSINLQTIKSQKNKVTIGLKHPSQFLISLSQQLQIVQGQIQFSKQQYMKIIIKDTSYIESQDIYIQNKTYLTKILYNYGQSLQIKDRKFRLIDDQFVYFNEILIRQILSKLEPRNNIIISFNDNNKTITLDGNLDNMPRITLVRDYYEFELKLSGKELKYIATSDTQVPTCIGLHAFNQFSKFQIIGQSIIFKRTSNLYLLYLFLGYFFSFTIIIIMYHSKDIFATFSFVRNMLKCLLFHDRIARMQVIRIQLQ